jgi:hypothetical protein
VGVPVIAMMVPPDNRQNAPIASSEHTPQIAIAKITPVVPVKNFKNVSMQY